jgi:hypothetical protein
MWYLFSTFIACERMHEYVVKTRIATKLINYSVHDYYSTSKGTKTAIMSTKTTQNTNCLLLKVNDLQCLSD